MPASGDRSCVEDVHGAGRQANPKGQRLTQPSLIRRASKRRSMNPPRKQGTLGGNLFRPNVCLTSTRRFLKETRDPLAAVYSSAAGGAPRVERREEMGRGRTITDVGSAMRGPGTAALGCPPPLGCAVRCPAPLGCGAPLGRTGPGLSTGSASPGLTGSTSTPSTGGMGTGTSQPPPNAR